MARSREQVAQTGFVGRRLLPSEAGVLISRQSHAINLQPCLRPACGWRAGRPPRLSGSSASTPAYSRTLDPFHSSARLTRPRRGRKPHLGGLPKNLGGYRVIKLSMLPRYGATNTKRRTWSRPTRRFSRRLSFPRAVPARRRGTLLCPSRPSHSPDRGGENLRFPS